LYVYTYNTRSAKVCEIHKLGKVVGTAVEAAEELLVLDIDELGELGIEFMETNPAKKNVNVIQTVAKVEQEGQTLVVCQLFVKQLTPLGYYIAALAELKELEQFGGIKLVRCLDDPRDRASKRLKAATDLVDLT